MLKKVLIGSGIVLLVLVAAFVAFIGPWPTYSTGFEGTAYFNTTMASIDKNAKDNEITAQPGRLMVGWGVRDITPPAGVPMAGYSARKGTATGAHDDLHVKALALSDGKDYAVIVGADMLLVPPNVAEKVREEVAKQTPLTPNDILFGASHTHDGPGGFGPGIGAKITGGKFDPRVPALLIEGFTGAIVEAYNSLEPGRIAHSSIQADKFIRNRAREAEVDPELSFLVAQQDRGPRYILMNFSAHPTTVGAKFMEFTAEYPGFLQAFVEKSTAATAAYLGGALGSMGPKAPEGDSDIARAQAMGESLGQLVVEAVQQLPETAWENSADVNTVGTAIELPPFQMRIRQSWRVSPFLPRLLGLPSEGWMQAVRVGDLQFVGVPGDFSGEISAQWKKWAADQGLDMWTSSFCADYVGYISPDKYYNGKDAIDDYETGLMSWTGPHQEEYFTTLMRHMVEALGPMPKQNPEPKKTDDTGSV
jgi:hypothetical protein